MKHAIAGMQPVTVHAVSKSLATDMAHRCAKAPNGNVLVARDIREQPAMSVRVSTEIVMELAMRQFRVIMVRLNAVHPA